MRKIFSKTTIVLGLAISFAIPSYAQAQQTGISYDYVEVGVLKGEVLDEDFTGYGIMGSFSINDSFFAKGSYSSGESDDEFGSGFSRDNIEVTGFTFGVGYHTPLGSSTDFVAGVDYVNAEVEFANISEDANGYGVNLGLRSMVMSNLELEAQVIYTDGSDSDGEVSFSADAKFFITPRFALTVGYVDGDDSSGVAAGLRLNF